MWQNCFKSTVIYLFILYTEFDEILHNLFSFLMEFGIASPVHPILWIQQLYEAAPVLLPDFFFFFLYGLRYSCHCRMASSFKIPKKKHPHGSDSSPLDMESPLSRLQTSTPRLKVVFLNLPRVIRLSPWSDITFL